MKIIKFIFVDVGGNPTILVRSKVARRGQPRVAKLLLRKNPTAEQVGFIEKAQKSKAVCRLQMAGGEFCGNAARALGAYLFQITQKNKFYIESSGIRNPLKLEVKIFGGKSLFCSFSGRLDFNIKKIRLIKFDKDIKFYRIDLQGIQQLLIPGKYYKNRFDFLQYFNELYKNRKLSSEAAGFIFYFKQKNYKYKIIPIIYVKAVNSLFTETSCASGSLALAIGLNKKNLTVNQISGYNLKVSVKNLNLTVGGAIKFINYKRCLI